MIDYGLDLSAVERDLALPDLVAEGDELDALVAAEPDWTRLTPAAGWTIAHQIAHLAAADANVLVAVRTPEAFEPEAKDADVVAAAGAALPRAELLERWRDGRAEVATALRDLPLDRPFPWQGSEVTATLMVPLRLMETWAHGQDVYDTLGVARRPTGRLRHVASLGVEGRTLSFYAAQLPIPQEPFRVELTGPGGETWTWGPEGAAQRIRGSALDFCLRVTQRRPLAETDLTAMGEDAQTWLEVARVFL
ncbi:TIGR03084 family metal-binding protein [Amycolatopsis sp. OK19-0408]|uniref:TIGR03084 family metal-binding protein n=1 Tax=Amycolatopsis iheyensis TaxID=2945988 RepID=A0A9X2NJA3_9PSEU|nr:TIGR03084 family metal-binding protein [Amycolatopsis iheyensis]MCR6488893.1 TIGR03084 family metal-binding protein [Amycolatopsis iheyensis]